MGADPSVVVQANVTNAVSETTYLQRCCYTFTPSTTLFDDGFKANAPYGLAGEKVGAELTINNYVVLLEAWGATPDEPIWKAIEAFFWPRGALASDGTRASIRIADRVFIVRRTRATPTVHNIDFQSFTAGIVTIKISPFGEGPGTLRTFSQLAITEVVADGIDTADLLRDAAVSQLNAIPEFAAVAAAAAGAGDSLDVTTVDGYPMVVTLEVTTGGPTVVVTKTSTHVANAWSDDFIDGFTAVENNGFQRRMFYWVHDIQFDDEVNEEAMAFMTTKQNDEADSRDYQYPAESLNSLNFDPLSAGLSPAEIANAAKHDRGSVHDHASAGTPLLEYYVAALLGRTAAYRPGLVSFDSRQLDGSRPAAVISRQNAGANEALATDRFFSYYGDEGPSGGTRNGFLASSAPGNPRYMDQKWLEDFLKYNVTQNLINLKQVSDIVPYTDDGINAGLDVVKSTVASDPAIITESVVVTAKRRVEVDPQLLTNRTYVDYTVSCLSVGEINRFGTKAQPISITVSTS